MPALVYPYPSFTSGTAISSSQIIGNYNAVATLLNSTKLDADNIQALAITAALIAANAVTGAKLHSNVVDNSTLQYSSSQLSIKASGVSTSQLADAAVTQAKRAALGQQISSSSGNYSTNSATLTAVTNLSVTITSTGRPVFLGLVHDGTSNQSQFQTTSNSSVSSGSYEFYDSGNASSLGLFNPVSGGSAGTFNFGWSALPWHIYVPSAGTHTYTFRVCQTSSSTFICSYVKLIAYEL